MSKGGGGETVTQRTEIPDFLRPFSQQQAQVGQQALSQLQQQLGGPGGQLPIAGFTPAQLQGQQAGIQAGQQLTRRNPLIQPAQDALLNAARGGFVQQNAPVVAESLGQLAQGDFMQDPAFQEAIQASIRAAQPAIASTFSGAGGAGALGSGLAQTSVQQAASDAFAGLFGQERQRQLQAAGALGNLTSQERGRQLGAAQALPGLGQAQARQQLLGANVLGQVGGQQQQLQQQMLNAPLEAQQMLFGLSGGGINPGQLLGSQSTSDPGSGGLIGGLGGGLLGLGVGQEAVSAIPALAGLGGPVSAGLGALGFLGGLL